jgi:hypothetical protein
LEGGADGEHHKPGPARQRRAGWRLNAHAPIKEEGRLRDEDETTEDDDYADSLTCREPLVRSEQRTRHQNCHQRAQRLFDRERIGHAHGEPKAQVEEEDLANTGAAAREGEHGAAACRRSQQQHARG